MFWLLVFGVMVFICFNINDFSLQFGCGVVIWVMLGLEGIYEINVVNDLKLIGGDGNLLLVQVFIVVSIVCINVIFIVDDLCLVGNVIFDFIIVFNGMLDVIFCNKVQIDGCFFNVILVSIDGDSIWLMIGDSIVGYFVLGSIGMVVLGNGSMFNMFIVDIFDGVGGILLFNIQLGDDSLVIDMLIIKGDLIG